MVPGAPTGSTPAGGFQGGGKSRTSWQRRGCHKYRVGQNDQLGKCGMPQRRKMVPEKTKEERHMWMGWCKKWGLNLRGRAGSFAFGVFAFGQAGYPERKSKVMGLNGRPPSLKGKSGELQTRLIEWNWGRVTGKERGVP